MIIRYYRLIPNLKSITTKSNDLLFERYLNLKKLNPHYCKYYSNVTRYSNFNKYFCNSSNNKNTRIISLHNYSSISSYKFDDRLNNKCIRYSNLYTNTCTDHLNVKQFTTSSKCTNKDISESNTNDNISQVSLLYLL